MALAIIAGSAAGISTNKALLKNHSVVDIGDVVGGADQSIKTVSKTTDNIIERAGQAKIPKFGDDWNTYFGENTDKAM